MSTGEPPVACTDATAPTVGEAVLLSIAQLTSSPATEVGLDAGRVTEELSGIQVRARGALAAGASIRAVAPARRHSVSSNSVAPSLRIVE
jgi:hypothetical protein